VRVKKLINDGSIAAPKIVFVPIHKAVAGKTSKLYDDAISVSLDWHGVYQQGVVQNEYRNREAIRLAQKAKAPTLVLVKHVSHIKALREIAKEIGFKVSMIHGQLPDERQKRTLRRLKKGKIGCLIATTELLGEGNDIPNINSIVICTGGKSPIQTIQQIGRGSRTDGGKKVDFEVYDFNDLTHRYLKKHSKARMKTCRREGYSVKEMKP
jgi:superfamily II DNA or RNA helicase